MIVVLFVGHSAANKKSFVYISLRNSNAIKVFELTNNKLSLIDSLAVEGNPAAMTFHPSKKYLFVAQNKTKTISTFSVDHKTGKLSYLSTIKVVGIADYLSCDKTGNYLFSASWAGGRIASHKIENDGKLNSVPLQIDSNYKTAHCILIDNSNKFVLVADTNGDKISQYIFNSSTGTLTPNNPFELITEKKTGPRHLVFSKNGKFVFFLNEINHTVTSYMLENTGQLTSIENISTLPDSASVYNETADIHLTPDNKFLYTSNRGHNSIAAYKVNTKTGTLNLIGFFPTEKNPRSFGIDPNGNCLIVAGEGSNHAINYSINKSTGELTPIETIYVGKSPAWVSIVEF